MGILKNTLRSVLRRLPFGDVILSVPRKLERRRRRAAEASYLRGLGNREDVFAHHFSKNKWGDQESVSGAGSTAKYTEHIRTVLPRLVQDHAVRTILDAPCGDYNWFRLIEFQGPLDYTGADIVPALIERNRSQFERPGVSFRTLDIVRDPLPPADLWLCRDCLFHLSEREIMLVLQNFLKSDIKYLLTSTHPGCTRNTDIATGSFRLLNLTIPPYSFGTPLTTIDDWIEGFPERQLALWSRDALARDLESNSGFQRLLAST